MNPSLLRSSDCDEMEKETETDDSVSVRAAHAAVTSPSERLLRYLGYARVTKDDFVADFYMWGNILNVIGS
jgi:hypothetical protein